MKNTQTETGLLAKLFALVISVALLLVGFMFSVLLLAVVAIVGLGAWGYFWWKTRALRKTIRESSQAGDVRGQVIEGEAVVVEVSRVNEQDVLAHNPLEK